MIRLTRNFASFRFAVRAVEKNGRCLSLLPSRAYSTEEKVPAPTTGGSKNPKLNSIVDSICSLTLLETADLVSMLKSRLNISEIPIVSQAPSSASSAAPGATEEKKPAEKKVEQTEFTIKLQKFDDAQKAKAIRAVKDLIGLSLPEAKKAVEAAPKVLKEKVSKEEAENIKKKFEEIGAVIVLE